MNEPAAAADHSPVTRSAIEAVIRIGLILLLAAWCYDIVKPFIVVVTWAIIIAIAVAPIYEPLQARLGGRRGLASLLFTVLMLVVLVTPTVALLETLVSGTRDLAAELSQGNIDIPPPPERVSSWPLIGQPLAEAWELASANLEEAVERFRPQIKALSVWLLGAAARAGLAVLTFVVAIIIAGVLLPNAAGGQRVADRVFRRLAGQRGTEYLKLSRSTIRSVSQGILGVAFLQAVLAGIGFLVAGIPAAGFLALLVLILCIVQLGPALILLLTVIYVFSTADPVFAVAYLVWSIFVAVIDNVLKPLLLGRGVDVPVLVVFMGAIGGFISMGIIGLFVGSIVLVFGYTLLVAWLDADPPRPDAADEA